MGESDATWDADATLTSGGGASGPRGVDADLLVGRYVVGELIGRGGSGQVHLARDRLTGGSVAVKFVRAMSEGDQRQLRRELTALRLLDLPGVVRLLDDGVDRGQTFLVMEHLPGGMLSTMAGPYERWAGAARTLVETLFRVHAAGVVHRDLKPGNILLDAEQRPVITDFGLAQGTSVERSGGTTDGTPRYMPPEQWAGEPCDHRSDLYALGAVLWEMLVGDRFPRRTSAQRRVLDVEAPEILKELVLNLVQPDPQQRPESAAVVLEALGGGDAVLGPLPDLSDPVGREALEALVDEDPPTFLHLAEDAATLLLEETGGARDAVRERLASWIRSGWAHWHDGRLALDRAAISALRWERDPAATELAALSEGSEEALAARALEVSAEAWDGGEPGRALAVLESVLPLLEGEAQGRAVREQMAIWALAVGDSRSLRRALYRSQRAGDQRLTSLLQGARLISSREMKRAVEALEGLEGLGGDLELWRQVFRLKAWMSIDAARHAELLAQLRPWCAEAPERLTAWHASRGLRHYAQGSYSDALVDQQQAARLAVGPVARLPALLNVSATALETGDFEVANEAATHAMAIAREVRSSYYECGAAWLQRMARYRQETAIRSQPGLVDAAGVLSSVRAAQFALLEAAIAWRNGNPGAAGLAGRAARLFRALGHADGHALAMALVRASGGDADAAVIAGLCRRARVPSIAAQAAALGAPHELERAEIEEWLASWHLADPTARADVLSLVEVRERLGIYAGGI